MAPSAPPQSGNKLEAPRPKGDRMDEIELKLFRTTLLFVTVNLSAESQ
jgi:hypothetical protein